MKPHSRRRRSTCLGAPITSCSLALHAMMTAPNRRMLESRVDDLTDFGAGPISAGWVTPNVLRNRLLLALSPPDLILLEPWLERVPLPLGTRLVEPHTPIEHVYFLEEGIASVV